MKFKKRNDGFTLVELVVVIAILGILAGVGTVGYSGYIKKANIAADQTVLHALNQAFAVACIDNGTEISKVTDAEIEVTDKEIKELTMVEIDGAEVVEADLNKFKESMAVYFPGGTLKAATELDFDTTAKVFCDPDSMSYGAYTELYDKLKDEYGTEIETLKNSNLGAMGMETLMTETNEVVSWAVDFGLAEKAGSNFNKAFASYLGISVEDVGDADDDGDVDDDDILAALGGALVEYNDEERESMTANAIVLYAAQNSSGLDSKELADTWGGSTTDNMLKNGGAKALSEAAAIYGLYLSYANENNITPEGDTLTVVGDAMTAMGNETSGFGAWIRGEEGKDEMKAYKSAMALMSGAASDTDATSAVLTNGFTDPKMLALLNNLMGN